MNAALLVIGGTGIIGRALTAHWRQEHDRVAATTRGPDDLDRSLIHFDLADDSWPSLPRAHAAVLCAAVTKQDECRKNPAAARRINVDQTLKLIQQFVAADTFVVFISTNLVFDGTKPFCLPSDAQSPRLEYGRHKTAVEQALAEWPKQTAIVRLTKVFQPGLPLLQKWRDELKAGRPVNAFSDYLCSPISLRVVVEGLARIAVERRGGIWQFSGPADVSYADLARETARWCAADLTLVKAAPAPPGFMEHLPQHTTLDTQRAREELKLVFPPATEVVADCLRQTA